MFDETITGFRWHNGGAQAFYDVVPDLSTFGKALGNGFSISALLGKKEIMELGGLHHDKERVFLLSTTHGAENHSLAAALETMRTYQRQPVVQHLHRPGNRLAKGVRSAIAENGLQDFFQLAGRSCNLIYITRDQHKNRSQAFRTLFSKKSSSKA